MTHARHELDDLLGHPVRFSILAMLAAASLLEFRFVRDELDVSDSTLSKQVTTLEQAGYVRVDKSFAGKRARTWLFLTGAGRETFERHLAALRTIANFDGASAATGTGEPGGSEQAADRPRRASGAWDGHRISPSSDL